MTTVLITTSGTGSRLHSKTKYTNKSLVKVGDKYAICHIIEKYEVDTQFVITLGYYGKQVLDFLSLAYPARHFTYIWIDKYEGEGSSLGYSMLQAKEYLQKPFYFHCCDTILVDSIQKPTTNMVWVTKSDNSEQYSGIQGKDTKVISMNEKGFNANDYIYIGLSYIQDYDKFWSEMNAYYESHQSDTRFSDIHGIIGLIQNGSSFYYTNVEDFYDTGNLESLKITENYFVPKFNVLEKDNESLCFLSDRVIKFINDTEINKKRYLRGINLFPTTPKLLGFKDNFISMEFIRGKTLSDIKEYGEIKKLLAWAEKNVWIDEEINEVNKLSCLNFYKKKTEERLGKLDYLDKEKHIINGLCIGYSKELLGQVQFEKLITNRFTRFHGDFILDNIMKQEDNSYIIIDWRHEFDTNMYRGDIQYDLAKLRHNIIFNHKNILDGLFTYKEEDDKVFVDIKCNYLLIRQLADFDEYIKERGYNPKTIQILTSIIWLNMSPLYDGDLSKFLFYFGKFNLYLALALP